MINNLCELRRQKGLTQAQLAHAIGKSPGYISFLENGRSPLKEDVKEKLCEVLDCTPEELSDETLTLRSGNIDDVAARIKQLRLEKGISQREFSKMVGCANGVISEIEAGSLKPSDRVIAKISVACGVSKSWLLTGKESDQEAIQRDMDTITEYFRNNDLAREQVLALIKNGAFEK